MILAPNFFAIFFKRKPFKTRYGKYLIRFNGLLLISTKGSVLYCNSNFSKYGKAALFSGKTYKNSNSDFNRVVELMIAFKAPVIAIELSTIIIRFLFPLPIY